MNKIGITADCSSGLEYATFQHNIKLTRTTIHFGEETLVDGIDINSDEFYEKLKNSDVIPSTSAPSPKAVLDAIEELKQEGCTEIIHFPISFGLSDYGKNLETSLEDYTKDIKFKVINSNTACLMEGYLAKYAEILANKGYSIEEIIEEIPNFRDKINAFFVVNDLKYLVKNGRLSLASGMIGSLIKIKPILNLGKSGKIESFEKVRTKTSAIKRMYDLINEYGKNFNSCIYLVLHTANLEEANKMAIDLKSYVNNAKRIEVSTITPTVGAHIGCGILGIACLPLDDLKEDI